MLEFRDLRGFIDVVRGLGELREVEGAELDLEAGAITEVAASSSACPMILFRKVRGADDSYGLVTNLLHSRQRLAVALGLSPGCSGMEIVRQWKDKLTGWRPIEPALVPSASAPVTANILRGESIDLTRLPAPRWHELDGGRYLGAGVITLMKDPDAGWVNLGIYRLQLHDARTLGLYISPGKQARKILARYWEQGLACPVAISLGHDPRLFLAAAQFEPWGRSEYQLAGWLQGEPVRVVQGELTGLPVPADAEVVLEGSVPAPSVESRLEGPFGEATGYYASSSRMEPVIKIDLMMYRDNPIMHGAPPMRPMGGMRHFAVDWRSAAIWNDLEKLGITDVVGVWQYDLGVTVISLKQQYAGHAKAAALAATASRSSYLGRYVITVDEDIDPANMEEVMWALSSRTDPIESIDIIRGCWSTYLDARIPAEAKKRGELVSSRAVIDACRPFQWREDYAPVNRVSTKMAREVIEKWGTVLKMGRAEG